LIEFIIVVVVVVVVVVIITYYNKHQHSDYENSNIYSMHSAYSLSALYTVKVELM